MIDFPLAPTPGVTTVTEGRKSWLCIGLDANGKGIYDLISTPDAMADAAAASEAAAALAVAQAQFADYTALRGYIGSGEVAYITGYLVTAAPAGVAGLFTRDDADTTSADNGGTVIVAANGKRWKRVYHGTVDVRWFGVPDGDTGAIDRTSALQAAINVGLDVVIPTAVGTIRITDWLTMGDGQTVTVQAGARVNQVTVNKGVFRATNKANVTVVVDGMLHGPGAWSAAWTGNGGHDERGVFFEGPTDCRVLGSGTIRNFGHAQVAVLGGTNTKVIGPKLEGTHTHGTPLTATVSNFQMGVYVSDDDTFGVCNGIEIHCDISGTAHGVVREHRDAGTENAGPMVVRGFIHDIPAQHAIYCQRGNLTADIQAKNVALAAIKIAASGAGSQASNFNCRVVADTLGSHLYEVEAVGVGASNSNLNLQGVGRNLAAGAGMSMLGPCNRMWFDVEVSDAALSFQAQGADQKDIQGRIIAKNLSQNGVAIYSTNSEFKLWPTLRECNTAGGAFECGILVASASATVDLFDPDVTDADGNTVYGLFNSIAGSEVRVHGSATFTGSSSYAVRTTAGVITQWPTNLTLSGGDGYYLGANNITFNSPVDVRLFDGANSLGAALQDIEAAYPAGVGVSIPTGTHTFDAPATLDADRMNIQGAGRHASVLAFNLAAAGPAITVNKGDAGGYNQGRIADVGFSSDNATAKTFLDLVNVANFEVARIATNSGLWPGDSIGVRARGRQLVHIHGSEIGCARPIVLSPNATWPSLATDHFLIENNELLGSSATRDVIEAEDGVCFSSMTVRHCAIVGGRHGIYWNDTTSAAASFTLLLDEIRTEQGLDAAAYSVYLASTAQNLQSVTISNSYLDSARNGIYLRNAQVVTLDNVTYAGGVGTTALNITMIPGSRLSIRNCYFQSGATVTITNGRCIRKEGNTGTVRNEEWVYDADPSAGRVLSDAYQSGVPFTLAAGVTKTIAGGTFKGFALVECSSNVSGIFNLKGSADTVSEVSDPDAWFGITAGALDNILVYHDGANYVLKNNTAGELTFAVELLGGTLT